MKILAQIIGFLGITIWVISIQNKERKKILIFQSAANLLYSIEYFLLGAYVASSMNIISAIRCIIFSKKSEAELKRYLAIFIILILLIGLVTYKGMISLIPIIITILYIISSYKNDVKWNRITIITAAFIWIYYNYKVGAYITIVGNILEIISGFVGIIRFRKAQ